MLSYEPRALIAKKIQEYQSITYQRYFNTSLTIRSAMCVGVCILMESLNIKRMKNFHMRKCQMKLILFLMLCQKCQFTCNLTLRWCTDSSGQQGTFSAISRYYSVSRTRNEEYVI